MRPRRPNRDRSTATRRGSGPSHTQQHARCGERRAEGLVKVAPLLRELRGLTEPQSDHEASARREEPPDETADEAIAQANLGLLYAQRAEGDRSQNWESAIAAFEDALSALTRESNPEEWAAAQMHLGVAYRDRLAGDRSENQERAIRAFENCLLVCIRKRYPEQWAAARMNLGIACWERLAGDPSENHERAIGGFEDSLSVWKAKDHPEDWATVQMNLGVAYRERRAGNRWENQERAIGAFAGALSVWSRERHPEHWAAARMNLGILYWQRVAGHRSENREQAIVALEDALSMWTRETNPEGWAAACMNIGIAYRESAAGERSVSRDRAITAFENALSVWTREANPKEWAAAPDASRWCLSGAFGRRSVGEPGVGDSRLRGCPIGFDPRSQSGRMGGRSYEAGHSVPGAPGRRSIGEPEAGHRRFRERVASLDPRAQSDRGDGCPREPRGRLPGPLRRLDGKPRDDWPRRGAGHQSRRPRQLGAFHEPFLPDRAAATVSAAEGCVRRGVCRAQHCDELDVRNLWADADPGRSNRRSARSGTGADRRIGGVFRRGAALRVCSQPLASGGARRSRRPGQLRVPSRRLCDLVGPRRSGPARPRLLHAQPRRQPRLGRCTGCCPVAHRAGGLARGVGNPGRARAAADAISCCPGRRPSDRRARATRQQACREPRKDVPGEADPRLLRLFHPSRP